MAKTSNDKWRKWPCLRLNEVSALKKFPLMNKKYAHPQPTCLLSWLSSSSSLSDELSLKPSCSPGYDFLRNQTGFYTKRSNQVILSRSDNSIQIMSIHLICILLSYRNRVIISMISHTTMYANHSSGHLLTYKVFGKFWTSPSNYPTSGTLAPPLWCLFI